MRISNGDHVRLAPKNPSYCFISKRVEGAGGQDEKSILAGYVPAFGTFSLP